MNEPTKSHRGDRLLAGLLVVCALLIAFWQVMSRINQRPFEELSLTAADFADFAPQSDEWGLSALAVYESATAPAIAAFEMKKRRRRPPPHAHSAPPSGNNGPLLVRLMHGFNVVDCMRIKHYKTELIRDYETIEDSPQANKRPMVQIWRMTSPADETSIWVTSMLQATDFAETDIDTRNMAFPRVGTPDAPGWNPTGLKWSSLRHPIRNLRQAFRSRWNASRTDLLTFLRLRRPAWVSDKELTLVGEYRGPSVSPENETAVIDHVIAGQQLLLRQLQAYRATMRDPVTNH